MRIFKIFFFAVPVLSLLLISACSSNLNLKNDYYSSRESLRRADPAGAAESLPPNEQGTFINLMEKTYLNLLAGKPDIDELFRYSKKIDNQVQYKVSREIKSLFYVVTPEGYYASEHEVIWMHMLLSWGFSMKGNPSDARVEAKVAADLLSMEWSPEGRFDDPFMRVFLGCLWTMAGEWDEARVDFRAAAKLDRKLEWALKLAALDKKPERLIIILGGTGPEPVWNRFADGHTGIRGLRNISFETRSAGSSIYTGKSPQYIELKKTTDSAAWYKRHFDRNNAISDVIEDTKYTEKLVGTAVKGTAIVTGGVILGTAIIAGGIGAGGLIIYFGASSSADAIEAGVTVAILGCLYGGRVITKSVDMAKEEVHSDLDDSDIYRFVRFLPEYAWLDWGKNAGAEKYAKGKAEKAQIEVLLTGKAVNGVFIGFYPDEKN
jgi:hypothetical protein